MATGDQLFYFIGGLSNECRRYVELHQPAILQGALDLCLNFEHVHSYGSTVVPMELNSFQQRRFQNQGRRFGPRPSPHRFNLSGQVEESTRNYPPHMYLGLLGRLPRAIVDMTSKKEVAFATSSSSSTSSRSGLPSRQRSRRGYRGTCFHPGSIPFVRWKVVTNFFSTH